MKTSANDKIQKLLIYIQKLTHQLSNPSARHNNPTKLKEFQAWVSREIKKAQKSIDGLRG